MRAFVSTEFGAAPQLTDLDAFTAGRADDDTYANAAPAISN